MTSFLPYNPLDKRGRDRLLPTTDKIASSDKYAGAWLQLALLKLSDVYSISGKANPDARANVLEQNDEDAAITGREINRIIAKWHSERPEELESIWAMPMLDWLFGFWVALGEHGRSKIPPAAWQFADVLLDRISDFQCHGVPKLLFAYKFRQYVIRRQKAEFRRKSFVPEGNYYS